MTDKIDLYYWPTPNGWKIAIALEELALPYRLRLIDLSRKVQRSESYARISPNRKIPAIVDPGGPGGKPVSVFESGAILQYLARKTGMLYGGSERARVAVEEWLMWQMSALGPMAGQALHFLNTAPAEDPPAVLPYAQDRFREEVARLYRVLDTRLADNRFVAGPDFTIADIAIWAWASRWHVQHQTLEDKPNMQRWLDEVGARPAVQRGRALGELIRTAETAQAREEAVAALLADYG